MNNAQKKEWAKLLFLKENMTQQEIADKVGASRITINKWIKDNNWEHLKTSISITREEQLSHLYRQLTQLNEEIATRKEQPNYAVKQEADTISKLAISIEKLEKELGVAVVTSVFTELITWLRSYDLDKVKEISPILDGFVKHKLR